MIVSFLRITFLLVLIVPLNIRADCCSSKLPSRYNITPHTPTGMVWVPGGEFVMGSDDKDAKPDEKPTHRVKVDGFWMDATPVTNRQFKEFADATGYVTTAEKAPHSKRSWPRFHRERRRLLQNS